MGGDDHFTALGRLDGPDATRTLYDGWAESYDAELARAAYAAPDRVARALAAHATDPTAPLLDIACGTGVSGEALRAAGFTCLDGADFSPDMLARAAAKGIYRDLVRDDLSGPWPFPSGAHANITAVGAISPHHLPAEVLAAAAAALPPGGCLAFSFADLAHRDPAYSGALAALLDAGDVEPVFREWGPHLPDEDMRAEVVVLRRR
jgi:predicted TPR repeat methyltransferase